MTKKEFEDACYGAYRLCWTVSHGNAVSSECGGNAGCASKEEFLAKEYKDQDFMRLLLGIMPDPKKARALWNEYSGDLELCRMLTLSTAHIKEETRDTLFYFDIGNCPYEITVYEKREYGWWIHVPEGWPGRPGEFSKVPEDLAGCITFAAESGCDWLCLDRDGTKTDRLPVFDW